MSYTKLFDSILTSTLWLEDHHVVRVWIAMLATKDIDGVVEGSVPGLAHIARVTVPQCEDALAKFLAPDPYSRTKEFEGRRIEEVDGGWLVLNADKYRSKEDPEERREKERARKERWRRQKAGDVPSGPDLSRDVPPGPSESRHTDADPESDPGEEECPPARAHAIPPSTEPTPVLATAPSTEPDLIPQLQATAQMLADDEPARTARRHLGDATWKRLNELRAKVSAELMVTSMPLHPMAHGRSALAIRIRDCGSLDVAKQSLDHIFAVLEAEARTQRTVRWLAGGAFEQPQWDRAMAMTLDDAKRPRGGPKNGPRETPQPERRKSKAL